MLRIITRTIVINSLTIYFAAKILSGVLVYTDGWRTLLLAGLAISIANLVVKPVINLLLLPFNLVTLGLFRWVTNLSILYLVTLTVPSLRVVPFLFPGINLQYLIIPQIYFTAFAAFILCSLVLSISFHFIYWLLQE